MCLLSVLSSEADLKGNVGGVGSKFTVSQNGNDVESVDVTKIHIFSAILITTVLSKGDVKVHDQKEIREEEEHRASRTIRPGLSTDRPGLLAD